MDNYSPVWGLLELLPAIDFGFMVCKCDSQPPYYCIAGGNYATLPQGKLEGDL